MVSYICTWLENQGVGEISAAVITWGLAIIVVILLALLSDLIVKRILLRGVKIVIKKSRTGWDDALLNSKLFHRMSYLSPVLVIYLFAPAFLSAQLWIERVALVCFVIICYFIFNSFLNAVSDVYGTYEVSREKPIKGYVQVVKIFSAVLIGILVLAILMNRSPWVFLSGIGAMTAILLLIFKDSILGLVAGIQLTANKMIRRGDWISMPKYGADGDVIDVSLNTVKVQNWDKTITTIPTYALISDSFTNWRGMEESGGRRIKRAINIDMNSIKFCTEEMLNRFEKIHFLTDYIRSKRDEISKYNREHNINTSEPVNGRALTNLGTLRAYIGAYLKNHPKIHNDMTFLVRHLPPKEYGLPMEIYVFSNDQAWANYEAIQADIFDHILAVIPEFGLRVFQNPSGYDFRIFAGKAYN